MLLIAENISNSEHSKTREKTQDFTFDSFKNFKYLLLVYSADQKSGHDQHNDGKSELCFVGG